MKTNLSLASLCAATSIFFAAVSHGANEPASTAEQMSNTQDAELPPAMRSHQLSGELLGRSVVGQSGQKLGDVRDFVVDGRSGQILYAIVRHGAVLGIGGQAHAVPMAALHPGEDGESFTLAIDEARWESAPRFTEMSLPDLVLEGQGAQIFEYYGAKPDERQDQRTAPGTQPVLVSRLYGADIQSAGREIGEAEEIVVDLNSRRASLLVETEKGFAGPEADYVVSFDQVTIGGSKEDLTTSLGASDFTGAPSFEGLADTGGQRSSVSRWDEAGAVQVGAYASTENAAEVVENFPQPASSNEVVAGTKALRPASAPVEKVRNALHQDETLSTQAREVVVVDLEGTVVLRGTVSSPELKGLVEERAEQAASEAKIDNQIQVKKP